MSNSNVKHSLRFPQALGSTDYGLIISQEGYLKGIWVPDHLYDEPVPTPLAELCIRNYGVDPNAPEPQATLRNIH
jgi:hypothetical protein